MTKSADSKLEKLEQELEDTRAALVQSEKMARLGRRSRDQHADRLHPLE